MKCIYSIYDLKFNKVKTKNINIKNCTYQNIKNILKEFYKRIIVPLYIPVLMMLPFILITSSKENINYIKIRIFTFLFGLSTVIISETTIKFISEKFILNFGIIIIPIILFIIFYLAFFYKFNPKSVLKWKFI